MLHRSFKPAKCKTALKLAVSRMKLLNNKREVQVKQIKRELAQLLESGQVQTARIRVEHVVREEKTLTAYSLIEVYCELIAARLPIIESQKNCPIDLKEAITSVIFASPRCSDIPELADIKKHLTAKYGKEFISSAIELRPDCGVNRMLVDKLSAKAPDGPTKLKILTAIAEEHNVKWNPDSFSESEPKPPHDLLNGPNAFEMASKIYTEAPPNPARPNGDDRAPSNAHVPQKLSNKSEVFVNFNEQNTRPSSGSLNFVSTAVSPNNATTSGAFHPEERYSGTGAGKLEHKQSYPRNESSSSSSIQDWSMQFKDATSAAQAAAESAERASMAARAAAELSQRSSESPKSYGHDPKNESPISSGYAPKDESPQIYAGSKLRSGLVVKGAENNSFHGRRDEHIVDKGREELPGPTERLVRDVLKNNDTGSMVASLKSATVSSDGASLVTSFNRADEYSVKNSPKSFESEFFEGVSKKNESSESELKSAAKIQDSMKSEELSNFEEKLSRKQSSSVSCHSHSRSSSFRDNQEEVLRKTDDITYFEETKTEKLPSRASSHSHSSTFIDIHEDIFKRNDHSEDPFVHDDSGGYRNTKEMDFKENTARFDDYVSDNDQYKVDTVEYTEQETSSYFLPPSSKPSFDLSADSTIWSSRSNTDDGLRKSTSQFHPSVFSQSSEVSSLPPQPDDLPPAAFDDYDSPSSDIEEESGKSKSSGNADFHKVPSGRTVNAVEHRNSEDGNVEPRRSQWLQSSAVDPLPDQTVVERRRGIKSRPVSENKFDDDSRIMNLGSTVLVTEEVHDFSKDSELLSESSSESGNELNFESLTGGLRNKGTRRPPYRRKSSESSFRAKEETDDTRSDVGQSSSRSPPVGHSADPSAGNRDTHDERSRSKQSKKANMRAFASRVDQDDDNLEDLLQQDTGINRPSFNQKSSTEVHKKPSYFDSDNRDAVEDVSKLDSPVIARRGSAFSRRTKASSLNSGGPHSKTTVLSEESVTANYTRESKPYSSSSHISDGLPEKRSYSKPIISSSEKAEATADGAESKSSSSGSRVGETSPETITGRGYSKIAFSPTQTVAPSYGAESKLSSSSSVDGSYSKPNVPNYGFESKSSSSSSNVGETLPKTTGRAYSKTNLPLRKSANPSYIADNKHSSSSSYVGETLAKPLAETKSSYQTGTRKQQRLVVLDSPKPTEESRRSSLMDSPNLSANEPKSNSSPKIAKSDANEASKAPVTRESSSNDKTTHVHPNLPDSDAFTAFFQSLRQPRE